MIPCNLIFPSVAVKQDEGFLPREQILKGDGSIRGAGKSRILSGSGWKGVLGDAEVGLFLFKQSPTFSRRFGGGGRMENLRAQIKRPLKQVKLLFYEKSCCEDQSLGVSYWDISAGSRNRLGR